MCREFDHLIAYKFLDKNDVHEADDSTNLYRLYIEELTL
jgi:hypothetical protein